MSRVYTSEHKQFFTSVGFDLARKRSQFDNALVWYTSNPIESNLLRFLEAHEGMCKLVEGLKQYHYTTLDPQPDYVLDPDKPEKNER